MSTVLLVLVAVTQLTLSLLVVKSDVTGNNVRYLMGKAEIPDGPQTELRQDGRRRDKKSAFQIYPVEDKKSAFQIYPVEDKKSAFQVYPVEDTSEKFHFETQYPQNALLFLKKLSIPLYAMMNTKSNALGKTEPPIQDILRRRFIDFCPLSTKKRLDRQLLECKHKRRVIEIQKEFGVFSRSLALELSKCKQELLQLLTTCNRFRKSSRGSVVNHESDLFDVTMTSHNKDIASLNLNLSFKRLLAELEKQYNTLLILKRDNKRQTMRVKRIFANKLRTILNENHAKDRVYLNKIHHLAKMLLFERIYHVKKRVKYLEEQHRKNKAVFRQNITVSIKLPSVFERAVNKIKSYVNWIGNELSNIFKSPTQSHTAKKHEARKYKPVVHIPFKAGKKNSESKSRSHFLIKDNGVMKMSVEDSGEQRKRTSELNSNGVDVGITYGKPSFKPTHNNILEDNQVKLEKLRERVRKRTKRSLSEKVLRTPMNTFELHKDSDVAKHPQESSSSERGRRQKMSLPILKAQHGGEQENYQHTRRSSYRSTPKRIEMLNTAEDTDSLNRKHNSVDHTDNTKKKIILKLMARAQKEPLYGKRVMYGIHASRIIGKKNKDGRVNPTKADWEMLRNIEVLTRRFLAADDDLRDRIRAKQEHSDIDRGGNKEIDKQEYVDRDGNKEMKNQGYLDRGTNREIENQGYLVRGTNREIENQGYLDRGTNREIENQGYLDRGTNRLADENHDELYDSGLESRDNLMRMIAKKVGRSKVGRSRQRRYVNEYDADYHVDTMLGAQDVVPDYSLHSDDIDLARIEAESGPAVAPSYARDLHPNDIADLSVIHGETRFYHPEIPTQLRDIDADLADTGVTLNHPGGMDALLRVLLLEKNRINRTLSSLSSRKDLSADVKAEINSGKMALKNVEQRIRDVEKEKQREEKERSQKAVKEMHEQMERRTKNRLHIIKSKIKDLSEALKRKQELKRLNKKVQQKIAEKLKHDEIKREEEEKAAYDKAMLNMKKEREAILKEKIARLEERAKDFDKALKETSKNKGLHKQTGARQRLLHEFKMAKAQTDLDDYLDIDDPGYKIAHNLVHEKKIQNNVVNKYMDEDDHVVS